jgi:DNA polymerase III alpha subunit
MELFGERVEQLSSFEQKKDGEEITMTGYIRTVRIFKDKKERDMCFITVEGKDDSIDCVVFASVFKKYSENVFMDNKVQIKGKKDSNKLLIDSIKAS